MRHPVALAAAVATLAWTVSSARGDTATCPDSVTAGDFSGCIDEWVTTKKLPPGFAENKLSKLGVTALDKLRDLIRQKRAELETARAQATEQIRDLSVRRQRLDAAKANAKGPELRKVEDDLAAVAKELADQQAIADDAGAVITSFESTDRRVAAVRIEVDKKLRQAAFDKNHCSDERTLCLSRDGDLLLPKEIKPQLFAGDSVTVVVFSDNAADKDHITLTARTIRAQVSLIQPGQPALQAGAAEDRKPELEEVARLEITVADEAREIEVQFERSADDASPAIAPKKIVLAVETRKYLVEFGLALNFSLTRNVSAQGSVSHDVVNDLCFAVVYFPGQRLSGEPLQPLRSWWGVGVAADVTNPVDQKRYDIGLDISPAAGIAFNFGLALEPWSYVPRPETVDDLLATSVIPVKHYRPSFFFGFRVTPDVFHSAKAAYEALRKDL